MQRAKWDRGVPAECLLENGRHVRQQWPVSEVREAFLANYCVNLCLRFALHLRIEDHREEERMKHRHGLRRNMASVYHDRNVERILTVSCAPSMGGYDKNKGKILF